MTSNKTRLAGLAGFAVIALTLVAAAAGAGVDTQTADVVGQGPGGAVVSNDGATLDRSDSGISVRLTMPTPQPGTYNYPPGNAFLPAAVQGHPEAFSLWVFVFNYPDRCTAPMCDVDDIGAATPARGGVYNAAGHIEGGPNLTLSGHVTAGSPQFSGSPLLEPRTAFIHLAVAPHGAVNPALLPDQITKPIGSLPYWWIAALE